MIVNVASLGIAKRSPGGFAPYTWFGWNQLKNEQERVCFVVNRPRQALSKARFFGICIIAHELHSMCCISVKPSYSIFLYVFVCVLIRRSMLVVFLSPCYHEECWTLLASTI